MNLKPWQDRATKILVNHGTHRETAECVAQALIAAERDGQYGHGLSRLPSYAGQVASGKVDGKAVPSLERVKPGLARVDAKAGFAYPALDLACSWLEQNTTQQGIGGVAIHNSHHAGQIGRYAERLADAGFLALFFANSSAAIAPWGGNKALFGTNPIAFAAPRTHCPALVIDLSLAKVARGKIKAAADEGQAIPLGWALDAQGRETQDAKAALQGLSLPMGDAKGYALVLMVEILAAALTGAAFGFEASSFFEAQGPSPAVGQLILAIDTGSASGDFFSARLESLIAAIDAQEKARLPGQNRLLARERSREQGLNPSPAVLAAIDQLEQAG